MTRGTTFANRYDIIEELGMDRFNCYNVLIFFIISSYLLQVECAFRYLKDTLETRPIYHHTAENTKGHVFCSYLALVLVIELRRRVREKGDVPPWDEIIRDLRAFQAVKLSIDGKEFLVRSDFEGVAHLRFMAAGVKSPSQIRKM